jgi:Transglycosylase SLT domain
LSGWKGLKPEAASATFTIGATGAQRMRAFLIAAVAAYSPGRAAAEEGAPPTDNGPATLCGIVETAARKEGLPVNFFTRLIWRESAFHSGAMSPAGAQGVAQFMPAAATDRGLADPFDPAAAIPASAKLLAEFAKRFGNLGLAAAAYNAGPNALANWLEGNGVLPVETQNYVLAITGHDVEEWRGPNPPSAAAPDPDKSCLKSIGNLHFVRASGVPAVAGASKDAQPYYDALGHRQLLLLAADAHMTARAYVLLALKERGLDAKDGHALAPR